MPPAFRFACTFDDTIVVQKVIKNRIATQATSGARLNAEVASGTDGAVRSAQVALRSASQQ